MSHVSGTHSSVQYQGGICSHQHGDGTSSSCWSCITLSIHSNVSCHHQGEATIPRAGLNPRHAVEEGRSTPVASIYGVHALNVSVATVLKQLHENSLHTLGLVQNGLRSHLEASDAAVRDAVPLHQPRHHSQTQRIDVFTVSTKTHSSLSQSHSVFSCRHFVVRLQFILLHIL